MRLLLVVAVTGVATGAAAAGAGSSGAATRPHAGLSRAVSTAQMSDRPRSRRSRRVVRRSGRGRAHVPAWVLRRGPLPGAVSVPGLTAPAPGAGVPAAGGTNGTGTGTGAGTGTGTETGSGTGTGTGTGSTCG